MKKQELIKRIEDLPYTEGPIADTITINRNWMLKSIEQLDEPQKPVVLQFVADWYEENKDDFEFNVWNWIAFKGEPKNLENKEFDNWINDGEGDPIQTLVNMHQFGYEVEKEKRYLVKIRATKHCFAKDGNRKIYFSLAHKSCFTKKELEEAGFGWVFDCPGIKVEEVKDDSEI